MLFATAIPACGQVVPMPDAPPESATPPSAVVNPEQTISPQTPTFRVTTNLVNLYFVARDPHGKLAPDLAANDCAVYEDHAKQRLQNFTAHSDLPLTLGILLDTSLSQQRVLPTEQQAGAAFLRRILRSKDEAFLISFDVDVTMLADFTSNPGELKRAMDAAQINSNTDNYANGTVPSIGTPRGTLLYDAVYLAAEEKLNHETGRKALIVLTDGVDEGSRKNLETAIETAQKADAIVYVLLIRDSAAEGVMDDPGAGPMHRLAQSTGGQVFPIGSNGKKMQTAFDEIESELRTQYQASYTPTNSARDGAYRHIRVECQQGGKNLRVQARQGYYALPPPQP